MKRLLKINALILTSIIFIVCFSGKDISAADSQVEIKKSYCSTKSYCQDRYFLAYANGDMEKLVTLSDGGFMHVADEPGQWSPDVTVDYYNSNFEHVSNKVIKGELDKFSGFFEDSSYYYLVFSTRKKSPDGKDEVARVVKYTKKWKRLKSCSIKNLNACKMPYFSSLDMVSVDGKLYIKSSRLMRNGHQANISIIIRISDMKMLEGYDDICQNKYGYTSHSFNQIIAMDGKDIITADHGDAYPRGILVTDSGLDKKKVVFDCTGKIGQNVTGLALGGLAVSGSHYIVVGSSVEQKTVPGESQTEYINRCLYSPSDVFITTWSKKSDKVKTTYYTSYKDSDETHAPYIVEINRNRYIVMWEHEDKVYYFEIDATGKKVGGINSIGGNITTPPFLYKEKIVWSSQDEGNEIKLYSLPISTMKYSLKQPKGVKITIEKEGLKLRWNQQEGADGFYVYRKEKNGAYKKIATVNDASTPVYFDKKVKDGVEYTYSIQAFRKQGNTVTSSMKKKGWKCKYLGVVKNISTVNNSKGIKIKWSNMKSETGYYIYRKEAGEKFTKIATVGKNKTSYLDKNTEDHIEYIYYIVQFSGKKYKSRESAQKSYWRVEAKKIMQIKNNGSANDIYFEKNIDETAVIYRSVNGGKYKKITSVRYNKYKYADKNVKDGAKYSYRIKYIYKKCVSDFSTAKSFIYLKKVKLAKIQNVKDGVKLSWKKNKYADSYYVYRAHKENKLYKKIANIKGKKVTEYTDKSVFSYNEYIYRVYAVKEKCMSGESNTLGIEYIKQPKVDKIQVYDGGIKVSFFAENDSTIVLYRKVDNGSLLKVKSFTGDYGYTYDDKDVKNGHKYSYAVQIVKGKYKSYKNVSKKTVTYVSKTKNVKSVQKENKVMLSWDSVAGAKDYIIYNVFDGSKKIKEVKDKTSAEITLEENTDYQFGVSVVGDDYTTAITKCNNVHYWLEAPSITKVEQEKNIATIYVKDSEYYAKYELYRCSDDSTEMVAQAAALLDSKVTEWFPDNGKEYTYKMVFYDKYGNKKEIKDNTRVSYISEGNDSEISVDSEKKCVNIKWEMGSKYISGYNIYRSVNGNEYELIKKIEEITVTEYKDYDINNGNTYSYKIAEYGVVEGNSGDAKTIYIPNNPANLSAVLENDKYVVTWDKVDNAQCYRLYEISPDGLKNVHEYEENSVNSYACQGISKFYVTAVVNGVESLSDGTVFSIGFVNDPALVKFDYIKGGFKLMYEKVRGVDGYIIYRNDGVENKMIAELKGEDTLEYCDTEVESGKNYIYRVCGYINDGLLKYIGKGVTLREIVYMAQPKITNLSTVGNKVKIEWEAVDGAVKYTLCRRKKNGSWSAYKGNITSTNYVDTDVENNMEYEYAIIAFYSDMFSSYFDWDKSTGEKIMVSY